MLAALSGQISDTLRLEVEAMPGRVWRLLRAPAEIRPNSVLKADDVAETEALVAFVDTCRYFAGELAINETTQRSFKEIQQYLDGNTQGLQAALRQAAPAERNFLQSQLDTVMRLCATVFGRDYAARMGKAAGAAGASERKIENKTAKC